MQIINVTKMDHKQPCGSCHSAYRHIGPIVCIYTGLYLCGILISVNLPSSTKASIPEGCETNYQALQHTEQLPCVHYCKESLTIRLAAASSEIIIRQKPIITIMMLNENSMYMVDSCRAGNNHTLAHRAENSNIVF